jgi:hypothetical protein
MSEILTSDEIVHMRDQGQLTPEAAAGWMQSIHGDLAELLEERTPSALAGEVAAKSALQALRGERVLEDDLIAVGAVTYPATAPETRGVYRDFEWTESGGKILTVLGIQVSTR